MQITVIATAGNDTEGVIVEPALVNLLMPNTTDAQAVVKIREYLKLVLSMAHNLEAGGTLGQSEVFVNSNTTDTH